MEKLLPHLWPIGRLGGVIICLLGATMLSAQNPFEWKPKDADGGALMRSSMPGEGPTATANPFEWCPEEESVALSAAAKPTRLSSGGELATGAPLGNDQTRKFRFLFSAISILLILFAILLTLFRQLIRRVAGGLFNDNIFGQIYREREGRGSFPHTLLYLFFFLNAGLFLSQNSFLWPQLHWSGNPWLLWGVMAGLVAGAFGIKHLLLGILAYVFPLQRELRQYSFTIMVYAINIGLFLLPANVIIAFAPVELAKLMVFMGLAAIVVAYLFRLLRSLTISNRFILGNKFHFLLYICTVEIAPVLVFVKLIMSQL